MPRVTKIEQLERGDQPTLYLRTTTPVEGLPAVIGGSFAKLEEYLAELGHHPAEVPYVTYHSMDLQNLDVEIGLPVARAFPGNGEVRAGAIPGGREIFCFHRGANSEIEATYEDMMKWIEENGYKPRGPVYEQYYNGPDIPEIDLLTRVNMPVE